MEIPTEELVKAYEYQKKVREQRNAYTKTEKGREISRKASLRYYYNHKEKALERQHAYYVKEKARIAELEAKVEQLEKPKAEDKPAPVDSKPEVKPEVKPEIKEKPLVVNGKVIPKLYGQKIRSVPTPSVGASTVLFNRTIKIISKTGI